MRQIILCLAILAAAPAAAFAQSGPATTDDRFQIERQGEAYIRLDKKTGAVSTCKLESGSFDCRMSADERAALQAEIDRLSTEVEDLKSQTASISPGTGISKDGKELTFKLPSETEIKEVAAYLGDMFRRFVDAVKDLARGDA